MWIGFFKYSQRIWKVKTISNKCKKALNQGKSTKKTKNEFLVRFHTDWFYF